MTVERGEGFIHSSDVRPLPCTPIMICDGQINGQTRPDGEEFLKKSTHRGSSRKPKLLNRR